MSQKNAAVPTPIDNNCFARSICLESRAPVTGDAADLNCRTGLQGDPEDSWLVQSIAFQLFMITVQRWRGIEYVLLKV